MGEAEPRPGLRGRKGADSAWALPPLGRAAWSCPVLSSRDQERGPPVPAIAAMQGRALASTKMMKAAKLRKIFVLIFFCMALVLFTPHCVRLY